MKTFAALIVTLVMIFTASCEFIASPGTNTGNPGNRQPGDDSGSSPGDSPVAFKLIFYTCLKVDVCDSQSLITSCLNQVKDLPGYTSELGTTASGYATIRDLATAEHEAEVTVNTTNFDSCKTAINNLSCSDPLVQGAYSSADPTNFANTNTLFRASTTCTQVY